MKYVIALLFLPISVMAAPATMFGLQYPYGTTRIENPVNVNSSGQLSIAKLAGEDQTNDVMKVEGQFSYAVDDADIVLADAGFLHSFFCWPEDGTAEAGSVSIRDADAAGAGTVIFTDTIAAAAYVPGDHNPPNPINAILTTGLVIDFTTTTDVFCVVTYR